MPWQVYNSAGQLLQATDLVDGTVPASKLDTNAVTNAKVADDAIGVAELSATGTASNSTFLRGDNAWAAPSGGPSQATQADIEAETNQDTYIPPDLIKNSPGVAKAWALTAADGTSNTVAYNMASLTDSGTGDRVYVFDVDFSSANYAASGNAFGPADNTIQTCIFGQNTQAAGSCDCLIRTESGNGNLDKENSAIFFGDQ